MTEWRKSDLGPEHKVEGVISGSVIEMLRSEARDSLSKISVGEAAINFLPEDLQKKVENLRDLLLLNSSLETGSEFELVTKKSPGQLKRLLKTCMHEIVSAKDRVSNYDLVMNHLINYFEQLWEDSFGKGASFPTRESLLTLDPK